MNVSPEAVEAAARAMLADPAGFVEAAAPIIAAQALRDAAEMFDDDTWATVPGQREQLNVRGNLLDRADRIERGEP